MSKGIRKVWVLQKKVADFRWDDYCTFTLNLREKAEQEFNFAKHQRLSGAGPQCHWRLILRSDDTRLTTETP